MLSYLWDGVYKRLELQKPRKRSIFYFNIPQYVSYFTNKIENKIGGIAFLIKFFISFTKINIKDTQENTEYSGIIIYGKYVNINIYNIYSRPNLNQNTVKMAYYINMFATKLNNTIIVGDFNCKTTLWGSEINDKQGIIIEDIDKYNLIV